MLGIQITAASPMQTVRTHHLITLQACQFVTGGKTEKDPDDGHYRTNSWKETSAKW